MLEMPVAWLPDQLGESCLLGGFRCNQVLKHPTVPITSPKVKPG